MDRRRERQIGGAIIALLAMLVLGFLVWEIGISVQSVIALAIALTSFTLCGAIGVMCARLLAVHDKQPIAPSSIEGQFALLAGSVALFGILITGVFVITTFRMQDSATAVATQIVQESTSSHDQEMQVFRARHDEEMQAFRARHDEEMQAFRARHDEEMQALTLQFRRDIGIAAGQLTRRSEFLTGRRDPIFSVMDAIGVDDERLLSFAEEETITLEFTVTERGRYRIEATAASDEFDPYLYLYDGSRLLAEDDDGAGNLNARIEADLAQNVTYHINVEELAGRSGICTLRIQLQ